MTKQYLLSVIIPMYNLGEYIKNTLESIIHQDLTKVEIILIDDGSQDNTVCIAEKFLAPYSGLEYKIINKSNGGVSSARNMGIAEAKGEYIFFLDGDDYVSDDFIEILQVHIKNKTSDVVCWGYDTITIDQKVIVSYFDRFSSKLSIMTGIEALEHIIHNKKLWIWTCSAVYKREFILRNNMRYVEGCSNGEDQEFTFKALLKAKEVMFINKIMSFYVYREGSISNRYDIKRFDAISAMKRTYEQIINENNPSLGKIIMEFRNEMIIENYIYNLNSCYKHYKAGNIYSLLDEIDTIYPKLNKEISKFMKEYKGKSIKEILRIKLFLISPKLYFDLVMIKDKVKNRENF